MDLKSTNLLQMEIARPQTPVFASASGWASAGTLAARIQALWRSVIRRGGIMRPHKALAVRETVALGDRRFVSVIQFERQRFLIGCGSSSVTLLAQLPDELCGGESNGEKP
jgi:hypothetical protein